MHIQKGTILGFEGSWSSGLATLVIKNEDGTVKNVPCENAQTVRALHNAFGNVIRQGHTMSISAIKGKEIYYAMDDMGLVLAGFQPVETASEELIEAYESQKED